MRLQLLPTLVLLFVAVAFVATSALAVETTGKITGAVNDPKGLIVAGARVTITNVDTGVSLKAETNSDGLYEVPNLPPGTYQVKIEMQGFRTIVHQKVVVEVATVTRVDSKLELSAVTESVSVTEGGAKPETVNMALGATVYPSLINNLPTVGRNYTDFVLTQVGVQASSDRFSTPSVSGGRSQANNYLIEGIDNNDLPLNTPLALPSPDSLEEFRLIQNTINPEYGRNSGAVINTVAKSGTNELHGDAFEFYRGKGFNTNDFFSKLAGRPKPDFNRNVWGFTSGGPVYLPAVYNGKNKTFWFFSYQGIHEIVPQQVSNQRVFTAAERDLSGTGFFDWSAACPRASSADPCFTRRLSSGALQNRGTSIVPFVDSTGVLRPAGTRYSVLWPNGKIPTSNLDPIAKAILAGFPSLNVPGIPLPNSPGTTCGTGVTICTFTDNERQPTNNYQFSTKMDQNWKAGHHLSGYYFKQFQTRIRQFSFTGNTVPGWGDQATTSIQRLSITYVHVFNSRTTNEFRAGWSRLNFNTVNPLVVVDPKDLGFTGINVLEKDIASAPQIRIRQGWFTWGFSRNGPQPRIDETFQYTDNLSMLRGKHAFKFGFEIRPQRVFNPFAFGHNGIYNCRGVGIPSPVLGESTRVAGLDFLLGNCEQFEQASVGVNDVRSRGYYVYGQDEFHMASNLTLTYGVGWELEQPFKQKAFSGENQSAFRPGQQSVVFPPGATRNAIAGPFLGAPLGLVYPGDPGVGPGTYPTRTKYFAPRIGIAWSPSTGVPLLHKITGGPGQFSLRAGYGIYYNIFEEETNLQFLNTPPLSIDRVVFLPKLATPFTSRNPALVTSSVNPFPFSPPNPGAIVDYSSFLPLSVQVIDPLTRLPYSQNWNLTLERSLPATSLLRVGYVGSKGTHLLSTVELLDTGGRALISPATMPQVDSAGTSCVGNSAPECLFQTLGQQFTASNSIYHSLQVNWEKKPSHGIYFNVAYTLSKSLDNNSSFEDVPSTPRNLRRDRGLSVFDATHRLVLTYTWDLPGPKKGVLGRLVGGWGVGGITTFATGFPVTIEAISTNCDPEIPVAFFGSWCRPDLVGPVTITDPRSSPKQQFFSTSSFAASSGLGNSPRTFFHGPGINNWNLAILKKLNLDERRYFQFRFEFFNAFNHAQFLFNPGGQYTSDFDDTARFGRVTGVTTIQGAQRVIQLAGKFYW